MMERTMTGATKEWKQKRFSKDAKEDTIIRQAIRSSFEFQKKLEKNEPIRVTRMYPDGSRKKLWVTGHEILGRMQVNPKPLTKRQLKAMRKKLGMTQEELARWLMVSVATVRFWEQQAGLDRGPALRLMDILRRWDKP
jgi:DNA-binding XRE family transcriptional regulator